MARDLIRWHLELGGEVIARIDAEDYDFPWIYGRLVDSPAFERFRVYFADEDSWPETPKFDALIAEIRAKGRFVLREVPTDLSYRSFRLNQEGEVVWFRFSEPDVGQAFQPDSAKTSGWKA
jgi:hypothetical protein